MIYFFVHLLWTMGYFFIFIFIFLCSKIIFKNDFFFLNRYKNFFFVKWILLVFYNPNLFLFSNLLSPQDKKFIEIERCKNWPTLYFIHSKIKTSTKISTNNNNLNFKQKHQLYNFWLLNSFNVNKTDDRIYFIILFNFIKSLFSHIKNFSDKDNFIFINILVRSLSPHNVNTFKYNVGYFSDYLKYVTAINKKKFFDLNTNQNQTNSFFNYFINKNFFLSKIFKIHNNSIFKSKKKFFNLFRLNNNFITFLKNKFSIKFSSSSLVKYLNKNSINTSVIFFLRKNKVFNKSRYSRNRQTYRTGAYWCLYVNIIAVVAFYFWFYKFTMNFGYLWWGLFLFVSSFFISRALKYKFYNIYNIFVEIKKTSNWIFLIFFSVFNSYRFSQIINKFLFSSLLIKIYQISFFNNYNILLISALSYINQSFRWIFILNNNVSFFLKKYFY